MSGIQAAHNHPHTPVSNGASPYIGVTWHSKARKFVAKYRFGRHSRFLGLFTDPFEAALKYDADVRHMCKKYPDVPGTYPINFDNNLHKAAMAFYNAKEIRNSNPFEGITWSVRSRTWEVHIMVDNIQHHLGDYYSFSSAQATLLKELERLVRRNPTQPQVQDRLTRLRCAIELDIKPDVGKMRREAIKAEADAYQLALTRHRMRDAARANLAEQTVRTPARQRVSYVSTDPLENDLDLDLPTAPSPEPVSALTFFNLDAPLWDDTVEVGTRFDDGLSIEDECATDTNSICDDPELIEKLCMGTGENSDRAESSSSYLKPYA